MLDQARKNQTRVLNDGMDIQRQQNMDVVSNYQQAEAFIKELQGVIENKDKELKDALERIKLSDNLNREHQRKINELLQIVEKMNPVQKNKILDEEKKTDELEEQLLKCKKQISSLAEENELLYHFREKYLKEKAKITNEGGDLCGNSYHVPLSRITYDKSTQCVNTASSSDFESQTEALVYLDQDSRLLLQRLSSQAKPLDLTQKNLNLLLQNVMDQINASNE